MRCCCGRVDLEKGETTIHNDYQHEVPGGDRFCGPAYKHELRDLRAQLAEARAALGDLHIGMLARAIAALSQAGEMNLAAELTAVMNAAEALVVVPKPERREGGG